MKRHRARLLAAVALAAAGLFLVADVAAYADDFHAGGDRFPSAAHAGRFDGDFRGGASIANGGVGTGTFPGSASIANGGLGTPMYRSGASIANGGVGRFPARSYDHDFRGDRFHNRDFHGHHPWRRHDHDGFGVYMSAPLFWGPDYYNYYYPPAYALPALPPGYFYYCSNPPAYYPQIRYCPTGWQVVAPSVPAY